jgi:hypothetical protein
MRFAKLIVPLALAGMVTGPLLAQDTAEVPAAEEQAKPEQARIYFANRGGVRDWKAEGNEIIYFQDRHRDWYKAELFSPAIGLQFEHHIGIDTGPTDVLDKFSSVYVDGQRYGLRSLVKIDGEPPKKGEKS